MVHFAYQSLISPYYLDFFSCIRLFCWNSFRAYCRPTVLQ